MFNTDIINYVEFRLLEGQVDIILKALELYSFNFHNCWIRGIDTDLEDLRNALIFHTYNEIVSKYNNEKYISCYDLKKECKLRIKRNKIKKFKKIR